MWPRKEILTLLIRSKNDFLIWHFKKRLKYNLKQQIYLIEPYFLISQFGQHWVYHSRFRLDDDWP